MIADRVNRLRGLVQRYRVDRRLPPQVTEVYRRTLSLRIRKRTGDVIGGARTPLGPASSTDSSAVPAMFGSRRLITAGPLSSSLFDLGHEIATAVSAAFVDRGVVHFVVGRRGDGLEFGVERADRVAALSAIEALESAGWYVEWTGSGRTGVVPLDMAGSSRHVGRAREWNVFRAHAWGDQAIGSEQGVVIGFWETGSSGLLEKIGDRGQARYDSRSPATTEIVDGRSYPGRTAFPVGANLEHVADPIDIVYTWVDGADPNWMAAFRATAHETGRSVDETALDPARYHTRDELRYSLRSVWAHCGWVRTIWIVTAGQRPVWLGDDPRIRVVDHADILPASALPTFNSHAIEAALHHIDGLAEQFVYFNDDMLVARSTRPETFFTSNGLPLVFQSDARPPGIEDDETLAVDTGALRGRELLAETFGRVATSKPYHSPYPLSRASMVEMEERFGDIVNATQHSRFRASTDLSTAASFAPNYALATQRAVLGDIATEYVHVESGRLNWHLDRIRLDDRLVTYCINETHRDGGDHDERERRIAEFFDQMLPIAAPWEQ